MEGWSLSVKQHRPSWQRQPSGRRKTRGDHYNADTGGSIPSPGRCSRMPPSKPHRDDLTWSWTWSTDHPASDQKLEPAAKAAWPYALLCAWGYLNDRDSAHDLMDHTVQNVADYLTRHPESPDWKLLARFKSVLRRRAKQLAHKHDREIPYGSLIDLEHLLIQLPDIEQRVMAREMLVQLSPFAQLVFNRRNTGYSWREIATELDVDHTVIRRAYFRELRSLLPNVFRSGDSAL